MNTSSQEPFKKLKEKYDNAKKNNQHSIDALCISSYCKNFNEVDSRYVNLKIINDQKFIFFTNYNSSKALQFLSHPQISACLFWHSINTQIRFKANIKKTSFLYNNQYFKTRKKEKNALSISSYQSKEIDSYDRIVKNYNDALLNQNLFECPDYWGGYEFIPYEIEFWTGHKNRLNKREKYTNTSDNQWKKNILEP